MKTVIIYHGNCWDGFGAAWAAWKRFGNDAKYIPAFYGMAFPEEAWGCNCFVLDYSFPAKIISARQLDDSYLLEVTDFKILDHHKTAEADLRQYPNCCIFDNNKSGAMLAWEFFHPNTEPPTLIKYIQDRDLWHFVLPGSRAVSAWLRSWPFDFDLWNELSQDHFRSDETLGATINEGQVILRFQDQMVKTMADNAWTQDVGGYDVPITNATVFFSEVGEELCSRNPDKPFAAYYLDRQDGKRQWGLRSRGIFDVSEIAKKMGGGGHKNAAGFTQEITKGGVKNNAH